MRKIFLTAVMALIAVTVSAQVEKGFRMGAGANIGMTNVQGEGNKMSFGYGVNWIAEYNFSEKVYLQSGLGIQNIAHKQDNIDGTLNAYFLQLPVNIGYRFGIGDNMNFFVQAGPTLGYGINGSTIEWNGGGSTNYFDEAKRFDIGVGGRVGVEFSKLQLSLGTCYGVTGAAEGSSDYHNFTVNLGFAYMF